jgi:hypothetical protein
MKLSELKAKPQLVLVKIDDEDIVTEFGEVIEFYTWDRHPMDTFLKLAAVDGKDFGSIFEAVRSLVLDDQGNPILGDGETLPTKIMMRVIQKVVENMGKL